MRKKTHGFSRTRFYYIWAGMKKRCTLESRPDYPRYGGRGITFCSEWESFINFKDDMYESYEKHVKTFGEKNTTLDRVNTNKDYCKSNCKWSTYYEQAQNRRVKSSQFHFVAISPKGEYFESNNQAEFARVHQLRKDAIGRCIKGTQLTHKGWKFQRKNLKEN